MSSNSVSPNCKTENEEHKPTCLFTYYSDTHEITPILMLSCQSNNLEKPDSVTIDHMTKVLEEQIFKQNGQVQNVNEEDIDVISIPLNSAQSYGDTGKEIMKHKMSSSCAPYYDMNKVTSYNKYVCNYLGTGVDENGNQVKNPFKQWKGTLPSCDNSLEISAKVENDVKKLVYERAGGDEAQLDINEFICNISSFPF